MQKVKIIHTLEKPYDKLYAGFYIQEPIDGIEDRFGKPIRALHEEVGVREVPNRAISNSIRKLFDRCPSLDEVEYKTPRGMYVSISRGQDANSILKTLTEAGNYANQEIQIHTKTV